MDKIKHGSKTWVITYGTVVIFVIRSRQSDFFRVTPPCPDLPFIFRLPPFDGIGIRLFKMRSITILIAYLKLPVNKDANRSNNYDLSVNDWL